MDKAFIDPIVESAVNVFETMLGCTPTRTDVTISDSFRDEFDVTGVIGLSGQASGTVVISLEEQVALSAAGAMLCAEFPQLDEDVLDVVGELTNMIAGNAKSRLDQYEMRLALPTVITGTEHVIRFTSKVRPAIISFECEWGKFSIEVALVEEPERQLAANPAVSATC